MSSTQPTLTAINKLKTNPNNPRAIRKDQLDKLIKSLREFPEMLEARPIVVDPDYVVLGGNMRLKAAQLAGLSEVPVYVATWEEAKHKEFIIKDNGHAGEWDQDMLANDGWDEEQLKEWGAPIDWEPSEETQGITDPDDVPAVPEEPTTKPGDLWLLGKHRLLCGDSTKVEDVERLMDGNKAGMVFTDPPYRLTGGGRSENFISSGWMAAKNFKDGGRTELFEVPEFSEWISILRSFCADNSDIFIMSNVRNMKPIMNALEDANARIHNILIMHKDTAFPHIWYSTSTEFVLYYYFGNAVNPIKKCQTNVFEVKMPRGEEKKHVSQKPVDFISKVIDNHQATVLFEPFCGSGSTLIAAEKTGRKCYGMELDPKYCDVIVKRWEDFTGKKAELWKQ